MKWQIGFQLTSTFLKDAVGNPYTTPKHPTVKTVCEPGYEPDTGADKNPCLDIVGEDMCKPKPPPDYCKDPPPGQPACPPGCLDIFGEPCYQQKKAGADKNPCLDIVGEDMCKPKPPPDYCKDPPPGQPACPPGCLDIFGEPCNQPSRGQ